MAQSLKRCKKPVTHAPTVNECIHVNRALQFLHVGTVVKYIEVFKKQYGNNVNYLSVGTGNGYLESKLELILITLILSNTYSCITTKHEYVSNRSFFDRKSSNFPAAHADLLLGNIEESTASNEDQ